MGSATEMTTFIDHLKWTERHEVHDYLVGLGFAWKKHSEFSLLDVYTFGTVNFVRRDAADEIHTFVEVYVLLSGKWYIHNPIPIGHGSRSLPDLKQKIEIILRK
jgi:hypothetical protein